MRTLQFRRPRVSPKKPENRGLCLESHVVKTLDDLCAEVQWTRNYLASNPDLGPVWLQMHQIKAQALEQAAAAIRAYLHQEPKESE